MTEPIRSALTSEEWKQLLEGRVSVRMERVLCPTHDGDVVASFASAPKDWMGRHMESLIAAAAIALYGQPFGFTWEDVDFLREVREIKFEAAGDVYTFEETYPDWFVLAGLLADRIAALLPPREE